MNAFSFYRAARWCYLHHLTPIAVIIFLFQFVVFHNYIHYKADIGKGTLCAGKATGIYIHKGAKIGENCIFAHQVSVGGRGGPENTKKLPVIGNNVFVGIGAKILGDLTVGDDVVIGANAVITKDVPSNCIVAGVPARVIRTGIHMRDYL